MTEAQPTINDEIERNLRTGRAIHITRPGPAALWNVRTVPTTIFAVRWFARSGDWLWD